MHDTFSTEVRSHNDLLSYAGFYHFAKGSHKMRIRLFSFWDRKYDLKWDILSKRKVCELFILNFRDICPHENFLAKDLLSEQLVQFNHRLGYLPLHMHR